MDTGAPLFLKLLEPSQAEPEVLLNFNADAINNFASGGGPSDSSDSGGGSISVTEGATTVDNVTSLVFMGGSLADEGGGVVHYTPPSGGGGSGGGGAGILPLAFGDGNIVTPDDTGFTLDTIGTASLSASVGAEGQLIFSGSVTSGAFCAYRKAYSNVDFDIKLFIANGMNAPWGFYIRDSSSGNLVSFGATGSDNTTCAALQLTSTPGAVVSGLGFNTIAAGFTVTSLPMSFSWPYGWYRLTRVGTTYQMYCSMDGENWVSRGSQTNTWAATPDQFGFCFFAPGGDFKFWSLDGI